jgi:hypothetical protein
MSINSGIGTYGLLYGLWMVPRKIKRKNGYSDKKNHTVSFGNWDK